MSRHAFHCIPPSCLPRLGRGCRRRHRLYPRGRRDGQPQNANTCIPLLIRPSSSPFKSTLTLNFVRQAKALQASLMEIVDRVEIVKSEHEKLEGGNKFLQS